MREIILIIAQESKSEALDLVARMPEGAYKRQTERRIAMGKEGRIREFFWSTG